jgi:STE24 endopeptidase
MEIFTIIFLVFLTLYIVVSLFLNYLQQQSVLQHYAQVPQQFSEKITLESHQKAANYTLAKLQLSNIELVFSAIVLLGFTLGGGINAINTFYMQFFENDLVLGASIIISIMIIASIVEMPFTLYRAFVLEEKIWV